MSVPNNECFYDEAAALRQSGKHRVAELSALPHCGGKARLYTVSFPHVSD